MAGDLVRPKDLPPNSTINPNARIPADDGAKVYGPTLTEAVNQARPFASQAEAEAGVVSTKAMSPLTTKQAIYALGDARYATAAQGAKADTAVQPGSLATVATTGAYADLTGKPTLGTMAAENTTAWTPIARAMPGGGATDQVLSKVSGTNYDTQWVTISATTAVSYAPQSLTGSQQAQARANIGASDGPGYLSGLSLSNNASDSANDIDVAVGGARDSTNVANLTLASAITKRLDAAWVVGSGNGGRMSAAAIADTTYHVFLICRPDTGVVDVGFDVSPTSPTLPTNYTLFRRIGSIMRVAGAIRGFSQFGNNFYWSGVTQTGTANNPGTAAITGTAAVPTGINVEVMLTCTINNSSAASFVFGYVSSLSLSDQAPSTDVLNVVTAQNTGNAFGAASVRVMSNTSGQFRWRLSASTSNITFSFSTVGFIDTRGQS